MKYSFNLCTPVITNTCNIGLQAETRKQVPLQSLGVKSRNKIIGVLILRNNFVRGNSRWDLGI